MSITHKLKDEAMLLAGQRRVIEARIGLCYVAIQLDNQATGLAYTFLDGIERGCSAYESLAPLVDRSAQELLALFESTDPISSAVALATANALFNSTEKGLFEGPALETIALEKSDNVAMVGHFAPLVDELRQKVAGLHIFERQARPDDGILSIDLAESLFPQCQAAIITSTTLINHSLDHLMKLSAHCREVVLVGSSTPLNKAAFCGSPVTLLSGITITHPAQLLQRVSEGGGTPSFKPYTQKVNLRLAGP